LYTQGGIIGRYTTVGTHREAYQGGIPHGTHTQGGIPGRYTPLYTYPGRHTREVYTTVINQGGIPGRYTTIYTHREAYPGWYIPLLFTQGDIPGCIYPVILTQGGIPGWYIPCYTSWEAYPGGIYFIIHHGRHTWVVYTSLLREARGLFVGDSSLSKALGSLLSPVSLLVGTVGVSPCAHLGEREARRGPDASLSPVSLLG